MMRKLALGCLLAGVAIASPGSIAAQQSRVIMKASLPRRLGTALDAGALRIVDSTSSTPVAVNAARIQLRPEQFLAARVSNVPRVEIRDKDLGMVASGGSTKDTVLILPFDYLGSARSGRTLHLRPALIKEQLRYDPGQRTFRGTLLIALEDSDAPARREDLPSAIRINVVSHADSVAPSELQLAHTNLPLTRVTILTRAPNDSLRVQIVPDFDLRGVETWLSVRPTLMMPSLRKSAPGLGLKTVRFPVTLVGASVRDSVPVTIASDRGTLDRHQFVIGRNASAIVQLRTEGIGTARIRVSSPGIEGAEESIEFTWPVVFVASALLGGAVGGVAAQVRKTRRRKTGLLRPALAGMLIGFVAAVAYFALNVNLLQTQIGTQYSDESAVFAFALLGGLLGIPALAKSRRTERFLVPTGRRSGADSSLEEN